MGSPPTSVRHFGASSVNGRRRDPVPAANSSAVVIRLWIIILLGNLLATEKCRYSALCKSIKTSSVLSG